MNSDQFFQAVKSGDMTTVQSCVQQTQDCVQYTDDQGATALHYAALHGHRKISQYLVDNGANINACDNRFGATPAGWAIEFLRGHGALLSIEIDDLKFAIQRADIDWVKRLLNRFPALRSSCDENGVALSELAANCGDASIAVLFTKDK